MTDSFTLALRQLKLTNGEEVLCEVLDYHDDYDDPESMMVVRNPFKLVAVESSRENVRYYAFRPFMLYQGDGEHVQIMNPAHVVTECTPTRELIEEYIKAVEDHLNDEETQHLKSLDETKKAMNEYYDRVQKMAYEAAGIDKDKYDAYNMDSSSSSIIQFPGTDTKH